MKITPIKRSGKIHEVRIKKVKFDGMDSFNDYQVDLSWGQLIAIRNALEKDHADPLSDELHAELNYYLQNVPGPGESSEQFKAERDAATKTKDEAGEEVMPEEVPSDTEAEANALPPPPADELGDEFGGEEPLGEEPFGAEGGEFPQEGPKLSPEERDIIDRSLPTGPAQPMGGRLPPPPTD